eukprot:Sdes_comp13780_c0_seq1m3287
MFEKIYDFADYDPLVFGEETDYKNSSRARIIERNHTLITDKDALKKLIRYNGFPYDPISENYPDRSISARYDLLHHVTHKMYPILYGGIDAKVVDAADVKKL